MRRAFSGVEAPECATWQTRHLRNSYEPLLREPWILDIDSTVKPLYGHQEGAVKGYNPGKPGRPSHVYHTYFAANIRLVLDVEVQAGNQTASSYAQPEFWKYIDSLPAEARPALVRGDCGWGTERMMTEAEERKTQYLFQVEAKQQSEAAHPAGVFAPGLGVGRAGLEGRRGGVTAHRLEPPAPGNCASAAHPRRTSPGGKQTPGGYDTRSATGPWFCRDGQRWSAA